MSYDFTAASEFLDEIEATPQEIYEEICQSMRKLSPRGTAYHTLLTLADFFVKVTASEVIAEP